MNCANPHELCFERGWTDGLPVVPPHARAGRANAGGVRSPEHHRIFRDAHWERGRIETELEAAAAERGVSRYRRGGIMAVRAGGPAGP